LPADTVEVASNGRVLLEGPIDKQRDDVAAAYPDVRGAERCGFRELIGVFDLPSEFALDVTVKLRDGTAVPIATLQAQHDSLLSDSGEGEWDQGASMETEGEALELLAAVIRATKPDTVVETGTFTGRGTRLIAKALAANRKGHLHTIEFDRGMVAQLSRLDIPNVTFHAGDSSAWCEREAPSPIDVSFVDSGDPAVRVADVRGLWPKTRPGGLLLLHDTIFHRDLYAMACEVCGPGMLIPTLNGLGLWQKPPRRE
jgi:predicted O-methyltransferase YrrM